MLRWCSLALALAGHTIFPCLTHPQFLFEGNEEYEQRFYSNVSLVPWTRSLAEIWRIINSSFPFT